MMTPGSRWGYRVLFLGLSAAVLFVHLLPLSTLPALFPGPDILLCFALAWVQRRPEFLTPALLVSVFLLCDFVLMRPPGLMTLLVLLGSEFLRSRLQGMGEVPFLAEWTFTSAVMSGLSLLYALVLYILGSNHPSLTFTVVQMFMNIAFYPVAVLVTVQIFGLHRPAPGDLDGGV